MQAKVCSIYINLILADFLKKELLPARGKRGGYSLRAFV